MAVCRQPEPSALVLNEPSSYHFRVLDPVFRSEVITAGSFKARR